MKTFLLSALFATAALAQTPLTAAKNVFVLPMPGGLDQYLAVRLSQDSGFTVVTKADSADVVLTDQLNPNLDKSLMEAAKAKTEEKSFSRPATSSFTRGKGTIFLVDRQTGNVLWSTVEQAKSTATKDLQLAAEHIVERLNKARAPKK
jgi:hypothetical protein